MTDPQSPLQPELSTGTQLSQRLKAQYGSGLDPTLSLEVEPEPDAPPSSALFEKLRGQAPRGMRYKLLGEVARGGMGAILKIWDDELRRTLAMKVVLGGDTASSGQTRPVAPKLLERFLEEAQITGQLDHPGIVPVHELGLGQEGRVYFTMRLVHGEDLSKIYAHVRGGEAGWTQLRALGVILKVCEAMSYAHSKHVIHRDLKPANVMVGKFGEVYVMDWGLARVLGREDRHDLRIQTQQPTSFTAVKTDRRETHKGDSDSPLLTMDGDIVGTPGFMPPEQAKGLLEKLGPHSDVYSVGAMLYALIAGEMPYMPRGARLSAHTILVSLLNGPPQALFELAPQTPAELVAIVEKAMAREIAKRYPTMQALAEDLRAYIEGRVVHAYETGAWAEARKWVKRNKPLAASLAAALLAIVIGGMVVAVKNAELESSNTALNEAKSEAVANAETATRSEQAAQAARLEAEKKTNDVLSLSAQKDLDDLVARAEKLWPAEPEMLAEYENWLAAARELIDGRPADPAKGMKQRPSLEEHKAKLAELRSKAMPPTAEQSRSERESFAYEDLEARWWDVQLSKLVMDLESLRDPKAGLMSDTLADPFGWGVRKRYEFAKQIGERSIAGPEVKTLWADAIAAIVSAPKYDGLQMTPQMGLLPIGMDPDSGLWEFAHLQTGELAVRGADGKLSLTAETGLVFVLIPGGTFWMGAQQADKNGQNYDPQAEPLESPVHEVELSAYFLSKYEMTQGQWQRIVGRNPSSYGPGAKIGEEACSLLDPVEQVSWRTCTEVLRRLGLGLPTEAQWEYAARAGTWSAWWTGDDKEALAGAANLADSYCKAHGGPNSWVYEDWLEDGCLVHARVGSYRANKFGLHDVIGNVWEWCREDFGGYAQSTQPDDGERMMTASGNRANRGGSFSDAASLARSARRSSNKPEHQFDSLGLRPARVYGLR